MGTQNRRIAALEESDSGEKACPVNAVRYFPVSKNKALQLVERGQSGGDDARGGQRHTDLQFR